MAFELKNATVVACSAVQAVGSAERPFEFKDVLLLKKVSFDDGETFRDKFYALQVSGRALESFIDPVVGSKVNISFDVESRAGKDGLKYFTSMKLLKYETAAASQQTSGPVMGGHPISTGQANPMAAPSPEPTKSTDTNTDDDDLPF